MNEIQKIEPQALTAEDVKQYICPIATQKEIFYFLQIAKACNLNPFLKEIYLVKYGTEPAQILTSYNVYLQRAERSGAYAGLETTTEGSVANGNLKAVVKVYRKDWAKPLIHEVFYDEYVQRKKDGTPNRFWKEKPRTMITKVAISQSFRLAFPLDFQGMPYTQDELNPVEVEHEPVKTTVSMPKTVDIQTPEAPPGVISEEAAKSLVSLAKENGYTQKEVYEIIFALGYTKVVDILQQDYDTILKELSVKADVWRKKQEEIADEVIKNEYNTIDTNNPIGKEENVMQKISEKRIKDAEELWEE